MTVTYAIELTLTVDDGDSAEELRHNIAKSVRREWIQSAEEALSVRIKSIQPAAVDPLPASARSAGGGAHVRD